MGGCGWPPISPSPQHIYLSCVLRPGKLVILIHPSAFPVLPQMGPTTKQVPSPVPPEPTPPQPGLKLQPVAEVTLRGSIPSPGNRLQDHASVPGFAPPASPPSSNPCLKAPQLLREEGRGRKGPWGRSTDPWGKQCMLGPVQSQERAPSWPRVGVQCHEITAQK